MKNINVFKGFLTDEVNLNKSRIDTLEQKIESIKTFLKDNLDCYRKVEKQGSYAMQTIIKPVKESDEFDADLLVYCREIEGWEPADYIHKLYDLFKTSDNYSHLAKRKTRFVTLDYSGDFHLDLVPCVENDDGIYICNFQENEFEETDGTGYRQWLSDKTTSTKGELKRITRLLKYLRDHKKNFSVKSILLTTMLGNNIDSILQSEFTDIPTALLKIIDSLDTYLRNNPKMPIIKNPLLPNEDFNRHWNQEKYENICDKISIYNEKIEDAYYEEDRNSSILKWRKVFGGKFGTIIQSNSTPSIAITPRKPYSMGW